MGFFSHKSASSLPKEILDAVHTMKDDIDGKRATPQPSSSSSLPVNGSASPFTFSAAPAMQKMTPVNANGLTSPITVTSTDTSEAKPDPRDSSPFMVAETEQMAAPAPEPNPLSMDPRPINTAIPKERSSGNASFVSENVTLGAGDPVYAAPMNTRKNTRILTLGIIFIVLAIAVGGAFTYFMFFSQKPTVVEESMTENNTGASSADSLTGTASTPDAATNIPFSLSSPNYLSIDVETIKSEDFRANLIEKEKLFQSGNITNSVVEFFVTDKNNNPVAFARFATLMGIVFPQAVMSEIDESFSVYLYSDNHIPRVGLALSVKNKDRLQVAVKKDESAIPFSLQSLYLDPSVTKITAGAFKDGAYKTYKTRYFNIGASGLSNDYTFTEKHWIIGTSQNIFRKILDTFGTAL